MNGDVETFEQLYELFLHRASTLRLSDNTIKLYGQTCGKFVAWADAKGLTPQALTSLDMLGYVAGLKRQDGKPYAVNTIRAHARDLTTMFTFAHDYGILAEPITVECPSKPTTKIEYLSAEDQARIIEYVDDLGKPREAAIAHLLLDTGLRSNELTHLTWSQVSWNEETQTGTIHDVLGKGQNGGKYRDVHFHARSWYWLQKLLSQVTLAVKVLDGLARAGKFENPGELSEAEWAKRVLAEPIFWRELPTAKRLKNSGLAFILKAIGKALGLHLHPHKFRHTAIRNWVRAGMPLPAVMKLSGHSSLKMIQHYSELEGQDVENLYASLPDANGDR